MTVKKPAGCQPNFATLNSDTGQRTTIFNLLHPDPHPDGKLTSRATSLKIIVKSARVCVLSTLAVNVKSFETDTLILLICISKSLALFNALCFASGYVCIKFPDKN